MSSNNKLLHDLAGVDYSIRMSNNKLLDLLVEQKIGRSNIPNGMENVEELSDNATVEDIWDKVNEIIEVHQGASDA